MTDRDEPRATTLEDVLITEAISQRPSRPPDHKGEAEALIVLGTAMATAPETVLQELVDRAMTLCRADSAGVSLLDPEGNGFRWAAVGGAWASHAGRVLDRDAAPCSVVVELDRPLLFDRPHRFFRGGPPSGPAPAEALLAPFHLDGAPAGTVWAVSHDPGRRFDAEDLRLLTSLSQFAAAARQLTTALAGEREARALVEEESRDFAWNIVDTMRDPLLVLDADLRVLFAGREFYRMFDVTPEQTEGVLVYELGNGQWNIPRLRMLLERILPQQSSFRDFEVEHSFEGIGRKIMLLNAREVRQDRAQGGRILLVIEDVTARRDDEAARREAEARFTEMVKNVRDHSIFLTDPDGMITSWNVAAERIIGYTQAEAVGRHFSIIFTPEDIEEGIPAWELETAREHGRAEDERWHVRKGGERFWALGIVTPLHEPGGRLSGFSKILRNVTDRKRLEEALQRTNAELEARVEERSAELRAALGSLIEEMEWRRDLARRLHGAQEAERRRFSRDLHDSVGQLMTGLSLTLKSIETAGGLAGADMERLMEAERIVNELGRELHGLAVSLRPTSLDDFGLEAALDQLTSAWSAKAGIRADFNAYGLRGRRLPSDVETAVYRVVQEALNNVVKHARASVVSVVAALRGERVSVVIEDDGVGFAPDSLPHGRLGLSGMRERIDQVRGDIRIDSRPGAGTTIAVGIPIAAADSDAS